MLSVLKICCKLCSSWIWDILCVGVLHYLRSNHVKGRTSGVILVSLLSTLPTFAVNFYKHSYVDIIATVQQIYIKIVGGLFILVASQEPRFVSLTSKRFKELYFLFTVHNGNRNHSSTNNCTVKIIVQQSTTNNQRA